MFHGLSGRRWFVAAAHSCGLVIPSLAIAQAVQFDPPPTYYFAGTAPVNPVVADLNGDGNLDVAFADYVQQTVRIYLGQGNGYLTPAGGFGFMNGPYGLAAGDLDGDGRTDLAVGAYQQEPAVIVFLQNADGSWRRASYVAGGSTRNITLADLNGDGRPDVIGNCGTTGCVLLNNGDGTLGAARALGIDATNLGVGDFNRDGRADLAFSNISTHDVGIALGNGDGSFQPARHYGIAAQPNSIAVGDLDHDGAADLLVAQYSSDTSLDGVLVFRGRDDGTLSPPQLFATGTTPFRLSVADFNGDGYKDVAVGGEPGALVMAGDVEGNLSPPVGFPTNGGPVEAAADLNGDGRPDLVTLGGNATVVTVLLNSTSAQGFGSPQPVEWMNLVNATATGSSLQKTGACGDCGYDARGFSRQQVSGGANAAFQFTVSSGGGLRIAGWTRAASGTTPDIIDFGLRLQGNNAEVREDGAYRRDLTVVAGDILRISIQDNVVRYIRNGAPFYVSTIAPVYPLSIAAFFATAGSSVDSATVFGAGSTGGGGPPEGTTWTQGVNVTVTDTAIRKSSGCDGCFDAAAVTEQTVDAAAGFFEFTVDHSGPLLVAGLASAFTSTDPDDIDFGIRVQNGWAEVREHGVYRADTRFTDGDRFRISVANGIVSYAVDGVVFYTNDAVASGRLFGAVAFANADGSISNFNIQSP